MTDENDDLTYLVVVNHEEQYSILDVDLEIPAGWRAEGFSGPKQDCLDHIAEVWTDMRPLSLRRYLEEEARRRAENPEPEPEPEPDPGPSLAERLGGADHPVRIGRPDPTPEALRASFEDGYVLVLFTGTEGGTELGVTVDDTATDLSAADFDAGSGTVFLAGELSLDFEPVRCTARIDLATMAGVGQLELLASDEPAG